MSEEVKVVFIPYDNGSRPPSISRTCFDIEDDWVTIDLKIKEPGSSQYDEQIWEQNYTKVAAYTIEPLKIVLRGEARTVFKKGGRIDVLPSEEKKVIIVKWLVISYENPQNFLPLDIIPWKGEKVKLRLPNFSEDDEIEKFSRWKWKLVEESDDGASSLIVNSDYEIITSIKIYSFPIFTYEKESDEGGWEEELQRLGWEKEEDKKLVLANLPNLSLDFEGSLINNDLIKLNCSGNTGKVEIEGKIINLFQFVGADSWEIKQALLEEIVENIAAWKIVGKKIVNSEISWEFPIVGWERTTEAKNDQKLLQKWLGVKNRLIERGERNKKTSELAQYAGRGPSCDDDEGYYLFLTKEGRSIEVSEKNIAFVGIAPKMKGDGEGKNCLWYEITYWGNAEKERKILLGKDDIFALVEKEQNSNSDKHLPWGKIALGGGAGIIIIVAVWLLVRKYRKNKSKQ